MKLFALKLILHSFLWLITATNIALSQVNTFPYTESFEQSFVTGTDVAFLTDWKGNDVRSSSRIFQGADARTGSHSINIIPTSSFNGELQLSLDLTEVNNPKLSFYAFSKQNGSSTSTRPAILNIATSIDGGNNFLDEVQIGDENTFPNNDDTNYTLYEYELPVVATGEANVIVQFTISRGDGRGSVAELVIDDLSVEEQLLALDISSVTSTSNTSVVITFNQEVNQATAENTDNYSIDNDIAIREASRTAASEVTLTTSTLMNNNYNLIVRNVEGAASNTPAVNLQEAFSFIEALAVTNTTVIDQNTLEVIFNLDLNETSAETLINYSVDNGIGNPSSATVDATDQNKVMLSFDDHFVENNYTLTINDVQDNSTLAIATELTDTFSYLPLEISTIVANSSTEIEVTFNQDVATAEASDTDNYNLDFGFGSPASATVSGDNPAVVILVFADPLVNNRYTLSVSEVTNLNGNAVADALNAEVTFTTATLTRQIVINEIFVDPTGSNPPNPQVLPTGSSNEFIELYNASANTINLTDFDLTGGNIGDFALAPGGYVILTPSGSVSDFEAFGDVVAVTSWNSLSNGGEQIVLKDNLGNIVDSLTYDQTWYQDDSRSDGGWSIEQINPDLICSDANNWIVSDDARGASPGEENSRLDRTPDTTGPEVISVSITGDQEIVLSFNEIMDEASLTNRTYTLDNGLSVTNAVAAIPGLRSVTLSLDAAMTSGTIYTLAATGVTDCAGNAVASGEISFLFDNQAPVFERFVFKDSLTIDLIFDEDLDETIAETESNYSYDLGIGSPERATLTSDQTNRIRLELGQGLEIGTDYNLTFENLEDTLGNSIIKTTEGFTFSNAIDTVIVVSSQLLDVYFQEEVNEISAENVSFYTVDNDVGNPQTALLDDDNSRLVHLVFESRFNENRNLTMEFESITNGNGDFLQLLNTVFVYDTDRPGVDMVEALDANTLLVTFDEALDLTSAEAINNYSVNNDIRTPASAVLQSDGFSVKLTFAQSFQDEVENTISILGIQDLAMNEITSTRNFDFTYDVIAPRLSELRVISPTVLRLTFSEELDLTTAQAVANYNVDNGIGNPTSASLSQRESNVVLLEFSSLGNNSVNTLSVNNLEDLNDNVLSGTITKDFASDIVDVTQIQALTDSTIRVQFSKALDPSITKDITLYSLTEGPSIRNVEQQGASTHIIDLTFVEALEEDTFYELNISTIEDTDGNVSTDLRQAFSYNSQVANISVINENTLRVNFENELDSEPARVNSHFTLNNGLGNPISVVLDPDGQQSLTLVFAEDILEDITYQLDIQNLEDSFGDLIPASSHFVVFDLTAPMVTSVSSTFTNEITVNFNEVLEAVNAVTLNHYSLDNGIGTPVSTTLSEDLRSVLLTFNQDLTDEISYTLTIDRVEDLNGNALSTEAANFIFEAPVNPDFRQLVINEIYPDPEAESPLPNAEFVELFNAGPETIELRDFTLSDNSSAATLTSFDLEAGNYLILCSNSNTDLFEEFGSVMGLTNFPSLSNTGETITLKRRDGQVVDSLQYDTDFYNDVNRQDGGYTIELINPEAPCFDTANYAASNDANQGTPGAQNSVFDNTPDTTVPELTSLEVITDQQLRITFNESMDVGSIAASDFTVSGNVAVTDIEIVDEFGAEVLINLTEAFERGIELTLTIDGVTDCAGNNIAETSSLFFLGAQPTANEIIITEIMANPAPSQGLPEVEYLEIFNASDKILSLEGLTLSDRTGSANLPPTTFGPGEYLILTSTGNANEFTGITVAGVSGFPSLNTSGDSLAIGDADNNLIFDVVYSDEFYQDQTKAAGGFSLEMINPEAICFDDANWVGSNNEMGGTPGVQNSVFDNTPDTTAPELTSLEVITDQQLRITFNESMDVGSIAASDFTVSGNVAVTDIEIVDEFGAEVLINLTEAFERGIELTLTIDSVTDCAGNNIAETSSLFFLGATPTANEIIITEIMANPAPSQGLPEVEYLEIFNASDKILSLEGLTLSDRTGSANLPSTTFGPGEYLLLTSTGNANEFTDIAVAGVSGFPSLNTSGDSLAIGDADDNLIFDVVYIDEFYQDETKAAGGFSLEIINPEAICFDDANWIGSNNEMGGTPGVQNSVFDNAPDTTAPELVSLEVVTDQQLKVTFNESMDVRSITASDFTVSGNVAVADIETVDEFGTEILIKLTRAFERGVELTLTISDLADCAGNIITETSNTFFLGATPTANEIIITEIMANPAPSQGLPEVEYLEIFNASDKILSLEGLTLSDRTGSANLPSTTFGPGEYLLLTSTGNANEFTDIAVAGVSGFPSLNTSGDSLAIGDADDNLIFDVVYIDEFYQDETKAAGGFSLEIINPEAICFDDANWIGSNNEMGGTPGVQNSVFDNTPDTTAPELVLLEVVTDQQLKVTFTESMEVGSLKAEDFSISGGVNVASIEIVDEFGTEVLINLTEAFQRGTQLTLTIDGVTDCAGNAIVKTNSTFFLGAQPTANEIIITEIMANPAPSQGLPEVEYLEIFNASDKILTLEGLTLSDRTGSANLPSTTFGPGEYLILTSTGNANEFTGITVAGVSGFPGLNTSGDSLAIGDADDNLIFDVVYSDEFYQDQTKAAGGFSLEMINPEAICFDDANWVGSNNEMGGTPGVQNSVFDNTPDSTAPELTSLEVITDQQLKVTFNESMDVGSITASDFTVSGNLAVTDIEITDEFGTEVLINLTEAFERGIELTLTIVGVTDCAGNAIVETNSKFFLGATPTTNEIIITEIMANPSPSQGLPEVEYIEILNVSDRILSLQGTDLSDRTSLTQLPSVNIAPEEYLILTTNTGAIALPGAIAVTRFPSLNTSGDDIRITFNGEEIFSVNYTSDWYRDSDKAAGGFSLEMIDIDFPCQEANNWMASENMNGGTPGQLNAVAASNPDIMGPRLLSAIALTTETILLTYDERLETGTISNGSFNLSNGVTVNNFTVSASKKKITLTTSSTLEPNIPYTITSDKITDCSGNLIMAGAESATVVIAVSAEPGDILINEILFNPRSGGVRFVELYNNSNNFINLNNWLLAGASSDREISTEEIIIPPATYIVITTDLAILAGDYPRAQLENAVEMNSLPSFSNDEGTVAIINENDVLIDLFDYSEDFHSSLLDDVNGVSLERIRFNSTTNNPNNWQSASSTEGFATPGYANSQSQQQPAQNMMVDIEPRTFAPDVAGMAAFTTINFEFDDPGNTLNVRIYDSGGNLINEIAQNALVGRNGFFRWDGTHQNGSRARVGYYMIFFEIISPDGTVSMMRERVAIGTRF